MSLKRQREKFFGIFWIFCIIFLLAGIVTGKYIQKNINQEKISDLEKTETSEERAVFDNYKLRGTIFDVKGRVLSYTHYQSKPQVMERHFCDSEPSLSKYAPVFSNLIDGFSPSKEGLDILYEDILRKENISKTEDDAVGLSVQLTADAELSFSIYKLLYYINNSETFSSVLIMKPDGEILTMLSTPTFNLERYKYDLEYRTSYTESPALVNSNRHTDMIDVSVFSKICSAYFNGSTVSDTGYNRLNKLINENFGFSAEPADEKTFGVTDKNTIEVSDNDFIQLKVTPVYLAEMMSLCTTGNMYQASILKNTVDTNNFKNISETAPKGRCITSLPDDKVQALRHEYSSICNEYPFNIKDGFSLYGDYIYGKNAEYILGSYINDSSPEKSFIIVIKNEKREHTQSLYNMPEIFGGIIDILNDYS